MYYIFLAYRNKGVGVVREEAGIDNTRLQNVYNSFVEKNATCRTLAAQASTNCGKCIGNLCKQRYRNKFFN